MARTGLFTGGAGGPFRSCFSCIVKPALRDGESEAERERKWLLLPLAVLLGTPTGAFAAMATAQIPGASGIELADRLREAVCSFLYCTAMYVPLVCALCTKTLPLWVCEYMGAQVAFGVIAMDFLALLTHEPIAVWANIVLVLDLLLVIGARSRVSMVICVQAVIYLLCRAAITSAHHWPTQEFFVSLVRDVLLAAPCISVDFYLTRRFATAMHEKHAALESSVAVAEEVGERLADYATDDARRLLAAAESAALPPRLHEALERLVANLDAYRPHLPDHVLSGTWTGPRPDRSGACPNTPVSRLSCWSPVAALGLAAFDAAGVDSEEMTEEVAEKEQSPQDAGSPQHKSSPSPARESPYSPPGRQSLGPAQPSGRSAALSRGLSCSRLAPVYIRFTDPFSPGRGMEHATVTTDRVLHTLLSSVRATGGVIHRLDLGAAAVATFAGSASAAAAAVCARHVVGEVAAAGLPAVSAVATFGDCCAGTCGSATTVARQLFGRPVDQAEGMLRRLCCSANPLDARRGGGAAYASAEVAVRAQAWVICRKLPTRVVGSGEARGAVQLVQLRGNQTLPPMMAQYEVAEPSVKRAGSTLEIDPAQHNRSIVNLLPDARQGEAVPPVPNPPSDPARVASLAFSDLLGSDPTSTQRNLGGNVVFGGSEEAASRAAAAPQAARRPA